MSEEEYLHEFGSKHTQIKLGAIRLYLPAYTTALKKQPFRLHYVDAFAGTGNCQISIGNEKRLIPGSAEIGINCDPPFHKLHFIELNKRKAGALHRLKAARQDLAIDIHHGDTNVELPKVLGALDKSRDRAVVFLDPFGMTVRWETLKAIAGTKLADVWYLFPLSGLYRQASTDADAISPDKEAAITSILGTTEWKAVFYSAPEARDLFDAPVSSQRVATPGQMNDYVKSRLEGIFPWVSDPLMLYQTTKHGHNGAPLFSVFFAMANDSPAAIGLAKRFVKSIHKAAAGLSG